MHQLGHTDLGYRQLPFLLGLRQESGLLSKAFCLYCMCMPVSLSSTLILLDVQSLPMCMLPTDVAQSSSGGVTIYYYYVLPV